MTDIKNHAESLTSATKELVAAMQNSAENLAQLTSVLSAILDSMAVGVLVFDQHGQVILTNRKMVELAGRRLVGLSRAEFLGLYSFSIGEGEGPIPQEEMSYEVCLRTKEPASKEGIAYGATLPPEGVWLTTFDAPIIADDGSFVGVVAVMQDNTERKRLERQRDTLAALIAHDTKNHLAAWNILFDFLKVDPTLLDAEQRDVIKNLKVANSSFLDLSSTLLELHRADYYELKSCRTDIHIDELLREAVQMNVPSAKVKKVKITSKIEGTLPVISGIPAAIRQAIHNLIQNSVEASPDGSTVEVKTSADNDRIFIEVKDHGEGMTAEQVRRIFDQKRVAASLPTATRATGFGLYLTRMLIDSHRGTISCKSKPGKGSTFTISLPLRPGSSEQGPGATA
jgi:PAS domain S-box-containing protein